MNDYKKIADLIQQFFRIIRGVYERKNKLDNEKD